MTSDMPECRCLACNHRLSAATGLHPGTPPRPNTLVLCIHCGAVMMFDDDLSVRGMTRDEMDRLSNDAKAMKLIGGMVRKIQMLPKRD